MFICGITRRWRNCFQNCKYWKFERHSNYNSTNFIWKSELWFQDSLDSIVYLDVFLENISEQKQYAYTNVLSVSPRHIFLGSLKWYSRIAKCEQLHLSTTGNALEEGDISNFARDWNMTQSTIPLLPIGLFSYCPSTLACCQVLIATWVCR